MTPIASPLIPEHWPRIWGLLQTAVDMGGEHTERSVLASLLQGGMVLWVDAERIEDAKTALVTSWCDYPAGRVAYLLFAGGEDAPSWIPEAERVLKAWARSMGCKEIRLTGRKGWAKLLGATPTHYSYSWSL